VFAELKDPVRRKIERYGLTEAIEPRHFFPTVGTAVEAFRAETGAEWTTAVPPPRVGDDNSAGTKRHKQETTPSGAGEAGS
jgi:hypothetical protein